MKMRRNDAQTPVATGVCASFRRIFIAGAYLAACHFPLLADPIKQGCPRPAPAISSVGYAGCSTSAASGNGALAYRFPRRFF